MLLSALQGLTEFLPVSSSGHLILFSKFTTFPDQGLALDVAVHVGSILAVMIYFSETIWEMIKGVIKTWFIPNFKNPGSKLAWLIVIGTIPAVLAGLYLVKNGTEELRSAKLIGWTMLSFGILLYIADTVGMTIRKISHLTILDALLIGLAQCLALIPGTSRSGITITMGRFWDWNAAMPLNLPCSFPSRPLPAQVSLVGWELYQQGNIAEIIYAIDGITYSFIASIVAIYIIMWWLKKSTFLPFVIYRLFLGSYLLLDSYGYLDNIIK